MFSRPGTEDTESDLLRFQEEFLAGRLNPSATVVRSNNEGESRPLSAGGKRVSPSAPEIERDVVTLEGLPTLQPPRQADPGFPPKKKSRFKSRRQFMTDMLLQCSLKLRRGKFSMEVSKLLRCLKGDSL